MGRHGLVWADGVNECSERREVPQQREWREAHPPLSTRLIDTMLMDARQWAHTDHGRTLMGAHTDGRNTRGRNAHGAMRMSAMLMGACYERACAKRPKSSGGPVDSLITSSPPHTPSS